MPPVLLLAALGGLALLASSGGKEASSPAPAAPGSDTGRVQKASDPHRNPLAPELHISPAVLHALGSSSSDKPAGRATTGDVLNRGVGAISSHEPYSPAWYKEWAKALGVVEPFPTKWSHFPDEKPIVWGAYNRERTLRNTAHKLIAWPGAGDFGGPQRFAAEFLQRGEAIGPSPSTGQTRYTWGPWQGLTIKGAQQAEALLYTPIDYDIHGDPQRIIDGVKNPRRMIAASILETIGPVLSFIPYVGSILSLAAETAAAVLEGKGVDVQALVGKGEALFTDVTGVEIPSSSTPSSSIDALRSDLGG